MNLAALNWVELNDIAYLADQRLQTRWQDVWSFHLERAVRLARDVGQHMPAARPGNSLATMELGCGPFNPFAISLVLYLNGADTVIAGDFGGIINPNQCAQFCYKMLANALCFPERYALKTDPATLQSVMERARRLPLAELEKGNLDALLECRHATFVYCEIPAAKESLPEGSLDFIYSIAALEHMFNLEQELAWHHSLLKPGAAIYYLAGLEDHRYFEDPVAFRPWTFMLDGEYSTMSTIRSDLQINGYRASELRQMVENAGFHISYWKEVENFSVPHEVRGQLLPHFQQLPARDLDIFRVEFVARKLA